MKANKEMEKEGNKESFQHECAFNSQFLHLYFFLSFHSLFYLVRLYAARLHEKSFYFLLSQTNSFSMFVQNRDCSVYLAMSGAPMRECCAADHARLYLSLKKIFILF